MLTARYGAGDEIKQDWRNLEGIFFEFCCSDMLGKEFRNQMKSRPHLVPPSLVALFLAERCTTSGTKKSSLLFWVFILQCPPRPGEPFHRRCGSQDARPPTRRRGGGGTRPFFGGAETYPKIKKKCCFLFILM